jgi:UDP-glucose 4-epimerase
MGFNLIRALHEAGVRPRVLSSSWPPQLEVFQRTLAGVTFFKGDIRDAAVVEQAVAGCEFVFHLAGKSGPVASNTSPLEDFDVNGRGMLTLLEACRLVNPTPKIVYPSSRLVYAPNLSLPVSEDSPTSPLSIYGVHKLAAEGYLLLYQRLYGLGATILRISNPYGPFQRPEENRYGIVNWLIHEAMHSRPLSIYGDGAQLRDYVHIADVVEAMLLAGITPAAQGKIFNVGSGRAISLVKMAELIIRTAGRGTVRHLEWPADAALVETGDFVADISLIRACLGWTPSIPLESGVEEVIAQYNETPSVRSFGIIDRAEGGS